MASAAQSPHLRHSSQRISIVKHHQRFSSQGRFYRIDSAVSKPAPGPDKASQLQLATQKLGARLSSVQEILKETKTILKAVEQSDTQLAVWFDHNKDRMKPRVDSSPRPSPGPLVITPTAKGDSDEDYTFLQAAVVNEPPRRKSPGKQRELVIEDYDEETRRVIKAIRRKELIEKPAEVDQSFRPEINKIFGKGGTLEQANPRYN